MMFEREDPRVRMCLCMSVGGDRAGQGLCACVLCLCGGLLFFLGSREDVEVDDAVFEDFDHVCGDLVGNVLFLWQGRSSNWVLKM